MDLQELINSTDLDMTPPQVRAFMLGALSAQRPMSFTMALRELLSQNPEDSDVLEEAFKGVWREIENNPSLEFINFFPDAKSPQHFLEIAKDQLDFFLTALSLAGTTAESCQQEELADFLDELEDTVMELDEYLVDEEDQDRAKELKEMLLETWGEFVSHYLSIKKA
jgi:hypothetical protein